MEARLRTRLREGWNRWRPGGRGRPPVMVALLIAALLLAGCATTFRHPQTGAVRECPAPSALSVAAGAADIASMALGSAGGYFAATGPGALLVYLGCAAAAREAGYSNDTPEPPADAPAVAKE